MSGENSRTANLLHADPPEPESGTSWGKPRRKLPEKPAGVQTSDVPAALMPPTPPPVSELVHVGDVCGYQIHARREIVEKAEQLKANIGKENWPSDALLATILALRMGLHPRPTFREIAVMLNMSERHVLRIVRRGKKETIVEREIARLDGEGLPMAVENVLDGLEARDKDYTLEFLKGRGVFKQKHETVTTGNDAGAFPGLVVQFIHDGSAGEIRAGSIVANPNRALAPGGTGSTGAAVIDVSAEKPPQP
jgi:hypothetical protein